MPACGSSRQPSRARGRTAGLERELLATGHRCSRWARGASASSLDGVARGRPRPSTEDGTGATAVIYLHGGGYVVGLAARSRGAIARPASRSAPALPVYALDYRLAPEHPFPAALDDARTAYALAVGPGRSTPARVVVASATRAGGGLALATALAVRDADLPAPGCPRT